MIVIEVNRTASESNSSIMRRFSKRVQSSGIVRKVKALKSRVRAQSHYKVKKAALKRLTKRVDRERLKNLGKIATNVGYQKTH